MACPFKYYLILLFILTISCNKAYIDEIDRGAGYDFRPGYPELRLSSTGFVNMDNKTFIEVSGDVVIGSLIYSGKKGIYSADFSVEIELLRDDAQVKRDSFSHRITDNNSRVTTSQEVYSFAKQYEMEPGSYVIIVYITDKTSGKQTVRKTETSIPDPSENIAHVTEIKILGKENRTGSSKYMPVTTYDIPARFDSLKFVFQVTNNQPEAPITLKTRLIRFRSDTTIARPMNYNSPSPSSIISTGINYDKYEEIQSSSRELSQPGSVIIEYAFGGIKAGNYRLEITSGDTDEELFKGREFGIKSQNYPSLKSPEELAKPLYYLMDEKQYKRLTSITDSDSIKSEIDRFWLSNIKNSAVAREVIALYYQRVEEANKQFSNFKEGWKTDTGMMYILFGPPWYSDSFGDQMVWSYSYNREDPERNFVFEQPKLKNKFFPFYHFILNRSSFYYSIQRMQIELWLSGAILRDGL